MGKSFAVYTDSSYKDEVVGYAFLYYEIYGEGPKNIYYGKEYALSSTTAELIAIRKAIEYIILKHEKISCIEVRCDNSSIINTFKERKFLNWEWAPVKKVNSQQQTNYLEEWPYFINLIQENSNIKITLKKTQKVGSKYHRIVDIASKIARKYTVHKNKQICSETIENVKRLNSSEK
jgi:ribonuclease HI